MNQIFIFFIIISVFTLGNAQEYTLLDYKNESIGLLKLKEKISHHIDNGTLVQYYDNGSIKSIGKVNGSTYTQCCFAGPCEQPYLYKIGIWKYYYKNGNLKAEGKFILKKRIIETSCEGGDSVFAGFINKDWLFFDTTGSPIKGGKKLIEKIQNNSVINNYIIKEE